jgi:hypothetical protein
MAMGGTTAHASHTPAGLQVLGPEVVTGIRLVCSDRKPYCQVMAAQVGEALHVLDRFPITSHLNPAVDPVRRAASSRLRAQSLARLKATQRHNGSSTGAGSYGGAAAGYAGGHGSSSTLLVGQLATARAWEWKESFSPFLALPRDLGRGLSRILVLPGHAPPETNETSSPPAACP